MSALGTEFAVFRGEESEKIFVTDAYCPHLGANITVGGSIRGDCVTCPFHEWSFDGNTGKCMDIPYAEKVIFTIPKNRSVDEYYLYFNLRSQRVPNYQLKRIWKPMVLFTCGFIQITLNPRGFHPCWTNYPHLHPNLGYTKVVMSTR